MRGPAAAPGFVLLAVALLAGCSPSPADGPVDPPVAAPVTSTPAAPPSPAPLPPTASSPAAAPPAPTWRVGASPLPLRPDGFGKVLPTPPELRVRRLPTVDLLPPPRGGRFASRIGPVTPAIRERMGETWSPGCPVGLEDLRYVNVSFRGFDGRPHTGELVVAANIADEVVQIFRTLYDLDFPIEEMRLPTTADLRAAPTGDGSNTAAYVCRKARGQSRLSSHAYGTAIDVNPFHNPNQRRDVVLPELASAYLDRSWRRPGMLLRGSREVKAFTDAGFTWGGTFRTTPDPMHFSLDGR